MVANVLLKGGIKDPFYDLYLLGGGKIDASNLQASAQRQRATDVVLANYAQPDPTHTVLMLHRGMPSNGARAELYADEYQARHRAIYGEQIHETILPLLQLKREDIIDVRIARWGHALTIVAPG